jgi:5-enolpyruvylshikimate-3-phosphate synthase
LLTVSEAMNEAQGRLLSAASHAKNSGSRARLEAPRRCLTAATQAGAVLTGAASLKERPQRGEVELTKLRQL